MPEVNIDQLQAMRQRIILAKEGKGEYPSQEELRETYQQLRALRGGATASANENKKAKAKVEDFDLGALFTGPAGDTNAETKDG